MDLDAVDELVGVQKGWEFLREHADPGFDVNLSQFPGLDVPHEQIRCIVLDDKLQ